MGYTGTDPKVFDDVVSFAKANGTLTLPLKKEQPSYFLNSLLVPLLNPGLELLAKEVADPCTIDKTWMKATGAPQAPFSILDTVGINTVYNVNKMSADKTQDPLELKIVAYLNEHFIDQNKLGVSTGEGFTLIRILPLSTLIF